MPTATTTDLVSIEKMNLNFGNHEVLKALNLTVAAGENLVIMGRSGCGKSVLAKCIVGLVQPDSGSIRVLNESILSIAPNQLNALRRRIGFLFQSGALYDSMNIAQNLAFPLRHHKELDKKAKRLLVEEALTHVGLAENYYDMPSSLSGGMRKRIALARTIIIKPELILYDEPTTGLDPITALEISELLISIQVKYKAAAIIITHDQACARTTANRILVMNNGAFIAEGSYAQLMQSAIPEVQALVHP